MICPGILLIQIQKDFEKSTTDFFVISQDSIKSKALVMLEGDRSTAQEFELSRNYKITISIVLKPKSYTWILIQ